MNKPAREIWESLQQRKSVAWILLQFKHNPLWLQALRDRYRALMGADLEPDIRTHLSQQDLAECLYLLNAPLPNNSGGLLASLSVQGTTPVSQGQGSHHAFINAEVIHKERGTVTMQGEPATRAFGFAYEGPEASEYRWLQLIWRERIVNRAEVVEREQGLMQTSGGEYPLTHDLSNKIYNVDVKPSCTTPFYEDSGASIRTSNVAAIIDQPNAGDDLQSAVTYLRHEKPGTVLRSVAHFDVFLIHKYRPVYWYSLSVADQWTRVATRDVLTIDQDKVSRIEDHGAVNSLPAAIRNAIRARFPRFDYLLII
jgi:hypothetical protein